MVIWRKGCTHGSLHTMPLWGTGRGGSIIPPILNCGTMLLYSKGTNCWCPLSRTAGCEPAKTLWGREKSLALAGSQNLIPWSFVWVFCLQNLNSTILERELLYRAVILNYTHNESTTWITLLFYTTYTLKSTILEMNSTTCKISTT